MCFITRRIRLEVWHTFEITWLLQQVAQELTQMLQMNWHELTLELKCTMVRLQQGGHIIVTQYFQATNLTTAGSKATTRATPILMMTIMIIMAMKMMIMTEGDWGQRRRLMADVRKNDIIIEISYRSHIFLLHMQRCPKTRRQLSNWHINICWHY